MKIHCGICLTTALLLISVEFLQGAPSVASQPSTVQAINIPSPIPYAIIQQDANSRVWERTVYEPGPNGQAVPKKHNYTELATGLNYLKNGVWTESKEEIDVLPQGGAAATQGQHQVYFPGDIYNGQIELVTPDGLHLKSRPLGISYDDGTKTVLIAQLKDSVGELVGANQVIYPDAFIGFKADLRYTYRKDGFEQDIVLREQPPTPESFGLNSQNTRLQVLTEFFDTSDPTQTASAVSKQDELSDTTLSFGKMKMIRGNAFSIGGSGRESAQTNQSRFTSAATRNVSVYKSWQHLEGRTFLVEELPVQRLAAQLEQLPMTASANATVSSAQSPLCKVSATRLLPAVKLVESTTNTMQLAKADKTCKSGVVLDYDEIDSDAYDFTFQGDTTYYVDGQYTLFGTTTFKGGAVIKMNGSGQLDLDDSYGGTIVCNTSADHPAVFTSYNDNTVGEPIGSGSPALGDVYKFLEVNFYYSSTSVTLHDMRYRFCWVGIWSPVTDTVNVRDCQFDNVDVTIYGYNVGLYNVLIGRFTNYDGAVCAIGPSLLAENVTADGGSAFVEPYYFGATVALTNCLVTDQALISPDGTLDVTLLTNFTAYVPSPAVPIYQAGFGGDHYLTNGSPYRGIGTADIDPDLLADIQAKTTYAPQDGGWPDINGTDLGYHYPVYADSQGTDFWIAFFSMAPPEGGDMVLSLYISSPGGATGTVTVPGLGITNFFSVAAGAVTNMSIPQEAMIVDYDAVETNGIHVTASAPVSVYGINYNLYVSTAFTAYPTPLLGTNYCVMAYPSVGGYPSEFAIVATADNTHVTITPSAMANLYGHTNAYTETLKQGETYQIYGSGDPENDYTSDVTGTWITSDKPVGVFAGASLADVPDFHTAYANPLVQEQLPVEDWGNQALALSFAGRTNGDTYRVLAAYSNTVVTITGDVVTITNELVDGPWGVTTSNEVVVVTNQAGQFYDIIVDGPVEFQGSQPIQVAQFANGTWSDDLTNTDGHADEGDPCEILLPPPGRYLQTNIVITLPNDFDTGDFDQNFLNIIVAQSAITNTLVDGLHIATTNFVAIGTSGYYGAQITVTTNGVHTVTSSQPVGVEVYGWRETDAYGYFGGVVK